MEVVKGGEGLRVTAFSSKLATVQGLPDNRCFKASEAASSSKTTFRPEAIFPVVSSKSLPVATFTPARLTSLLSNLLPAPPFAKGGLGGVYSKRAFKSQYPPDRKARRSRSRLTSKRTATDCTRPADNPLAIFFHNRGERV